MEILIAGGGYVAMYTARRLERLLRRGETTVTVVDPRGYMTYQPFLAEAADGSVEPRHVIAPLPRVLRHTRVLAGKIASTDHASRLAVFALARGPERVLRYDVLVLAAGSVSRVLPVDGLAEYGAGFKTVSDAVHLRNHVLGQLAVAASGDDPAIRTAALTFVVVGGGFAGVEALAELQGLADQAVRFHPALDPAGLRWVLAEGTAGYARTDQQPGPDAARAGRREVDMRLGTRQASAPHGTVLLDDGTVLRRAVDFGVARGSIFALLGSNGAGKTTVVKILSTLLKADAGTASIEGFDVAAHPAEVRESISLTGQFAAVDEILTGRENLVLVARLRHLKDAGQIADDLLGRFQLADAGGRKVSTYSGGMRRRLDIAMSLIGNAPVIFLDEPTTGLDPESRIEVWHSVRQLAGQGTTVLLTTQYLDEAEHLADRIAILHQGRIIANGTLAELKQLLPPAKVEYVEKQPTLEDIFLAITGNPPALRSAVTAPTAKERR